MSQSVTLDARTVRQVFEHPRRRRSLLEEIRRVKANAPHRKIWRSNRRKSEEDLALERQAVGLRVRQPSLSDPAAERRAWRLQRRIFDFVKFTAVVIATVFIGVTYQHRAMASAAGFMAQRFLQSASQERWGLGRSDYFSRNLKEAEPPDRFARDIELLQSKLGKLSKFQLTNSRVAWRNGDCDLFYSMDFEKGQAHGYLQMTREHGRWVVDTFAFLSPRWKRL